MRATPQPPAPEMLGWAAAAAATTLAALVLGFYLMRRFLAGAVPPPDEQAAGAVPPPEEQALAAAAEKPPNTSGGPPLTMHVATEKRAFTLDLAKVQGYRLDDYDWKTLEAGVRRLWPDVPEDVLDDVEGWLTMCAAHPPPCARLKTHVGCDLTALGAGVHRCPWCCGRILTFWRTPSGNSQRWTATTRS